MTKKIAKALRHEEIHSSGPAYESIMRLSIRPSKGFNDVNLSKHVIGAHSAPIHSVQRKLKFVLKGHFLKNS